MCLSKNQLISLFVTILIIKFQSIRAECDVCQSSNSVACHNETAFSLCIDGIATRADVSCDHGYVCTADHLICYPKDEAVASCYTTNVTPEYPKNSCGVCNQPNKAFACISERKIAFCFGQDKPNYESTAICPEGTVCDLKNKMEFCTSITEVEPSCIPVDDDVTPTTIRQNDATNDMRDLSQIITAFTEVPITTITSTESPTTPIATTTLETSRKDSTTAKIISDETTVSTTSEQTTMPTTKPPTTTTTTTKPTTTTTTTATTKPPTTTTTTTTTTTKPTTTTTTTATTKPPTTTTTTSKPTTTTTTTTTTKPTTTTTPTTTTEGTTTLRLPRDPNTLCKEIGQPGASYPLDNDTVCKKFVMCYRSNGVLRGLSLSCEPGLYFNPDYGICIAEKPAYCV